MKKPYMLIILVICAIIIGIYEYHEYFRDSYEVGNITKTIEGPLPGLPTLEN